MTAATNTLLIDSSYLCYRAHYSMGSLSSGGAKTGVIYGVLNCILDLAEKFSTNDLMFFWDSKRSLRKDRHPWYKEGRSAQRKDASGLDEAYDQFRQLRMEVLPKLGFRNNFIATGYESDDLIGRVVQDTLGRFVIVAADSDLYQLLYNARIYNPSKRITWTARNFQSSADVTYSEWVKVKQIGGCKSDSVPGIPGVGETTAIKYLRGRLSRKSKAFQAIESDEGRQIIERNHWLVKLPLEGAPLPKPAPNEFDLEKLRLVCYRYGFDSFLDGIARWERFFAGDFE